MATQRDEATDSIVDRCPRRDTARTSKMCQYRTVFKEAATLRSGLADWESTQHLFFDPEEFEKAVATILIFQIEAT
ncbi:MAG: hypothetical protein CMJ43_03330 [Phyllobacteriaceae bacterium]|nr:hypothetical protein [Phyllobacteriaceae bacterium]